MADCHLIVQLDSSRMRALLESIVDLRELAPDLRASEADALVEQIRQHLVAMVRVKERNG